MMVVFYYTARREREGGEGRRRPYSKPTITITNYKDEKRLF